MLQEVSTSIVTDGDGAATVYLGTKLRGRVHAIKYTAGTLENTTDLVITGKTTGVAILTDSPATSEWFYPRAIPNKNTDGTAFTNVAAEIHVLNEQIKVVVAQGGDTKTGTITAYVDSPSPY